MTNANIAHSEQLIPVFSAKIGGIEVAACDARALHTYLQNGKQFADWIKDRIQKYEFKENQDFILISLNSEIKSNHGGDRRSKDYHITIVMAKELAMVENNAKGREVRRYFIECERRLHKQPQYQNFHSDLLSIAKAAQAMTDAINTLVDKYASHTTTAPEPNLLTCPHIVSCEQRTQPQLASPTAPTSNAIPQTQLCVDAVFLTVLYESIELQPFTASELHRIILTRKYPALSDAAVELLGEISTWTARRLGQVLGRWSRNELSCHRVLNTGTSKNGVVWRLERVS